MPGPSSGPTYQTVLKELAASLSGPISLKDLTQQVLARKPSAAKNPKQIVRNNLRSMLSLPFVFLDPQTLLPTRLAMQGARFRLPFGRRTAETGQIEMEWFASYLPQHFDLQKVQFVDAKGQAIPAPRRSLSKKIGTPLGTYEEPILLADLSAWLRPQNVTRRDDLLVTVLDWQNGLLQLQVEPHKRRDPALIQARDRLLADLLYAILESAHSERVWVHEALPTAYAHLPEKEGCPPHHWQIVLGQDNRFYFDEHEIMYADGRLPLFRHLLQEQTGQRLSRRQQPVTKEQKQLVYRFKAAFKYNPHIWRRVEILGEQTLADLNALLVYAFSHESDHLAGFWKLVPRQGAKTRYREVDLGTVDPFGEGDGADVQIAAIGLKEGESLKYVFDFGDWIEHTLTLEAIHPAEEGVKYPRETARNKPRYHYCVECKENGEETIARWQCITCSDEQAQDLYYCDDCSAEHDDHYVVEIVY
jgi:hypothetical protein